MATVAGRYNALRRQRVRHLRSSPLQQSYVSQMVDYYRGLLGHLGVGVAEMIGDADAERIVPARV